MNWTQHYLPAGNLVVIGVDRRGSCRRIAWPARVFQTAGISGGVNGAAGFNAVAVFVYGMPTKLALMAAFNGPLTDCSRSAGSCSAPSLSTT